MNYHHRRHSTESKEKKLSVGEMIQERNLREAIICILLFIDLPERDKKSALLLI